MDCKKHGFNKDGQKCPHCLSEEKGSASGSNGLLSRTDAERLDWMINNSAVVCHAMDGENCWIQYEEDELMVETLDKFDDARDAIDAAMLGKVFER